MTLDEIIKTTLIDIDNTIIYRAKNIGCTIANMRGFIFYFHEPRNVWRMIEFGIVPKRTHDLFIQSARTIIIDCPARTIDVQGMINARPI